MKDELKVVGMAIDAKSRGKVGADRAVGQSNGVGAMGGYLQRLFHLGRRKSTASDVMRVRPGGSRF